MAEKDKKQIADVEALKRAYNRVARTKDGQVIFNHIMRLCGFAVSSLVLDRNTSEICVQSSLYNEARKTVYYELRKMIDKECLEDIEYLKEEKEDANDT